MKKLTLKNYMLLDNPELKTTSIQSWLGGQLLHGKASRSRTRFLRLINERVVEMDSERKKLLEEYTIKKEVKTKDKDGKEVKTEKLVYIDKDGKDTTDEQKGARYKMKDSEKFQEKYVEYLNEEYVIDVTPATSETIYGVRELLLETKEEFSGRQATSYDEWCQSFQEVK